MKWPHDDKASLVAFYGDPDDPNFAHDNLVRVVPPFQITFEGSPIQGIDCHRKCAADLREALNQVWIAAGRSQHCLDVWGVSRFSGSYVNRDVRGRPGIKSVHAFGAAFDFNAEQNGMGTKGNMPAQFIAAFKNTGATWGGNFVHRTDPMHFQYAYEGTQVTESSQPVMVTPLPTGGKISWWEWLLGN